MFLLCFYCVRFFNSISLLQFRLCIEPDLTKKLSFTPIMSSWDETGSSTLDPDLKEEIAFCVDSVCYALKIYTCDYNLYIELL